MATSLRTPTVRTPSRRQAAHNHDWHEGSRGSACAHVGRAMAHFASGKNRQKRGFISLSTNSKAVEVQDAGHAINLEAPEAVVDAIHDVMNAALHHTRLKQ